MRIVGLFVLPAIIPARMYGIEKSHELLAYMNDYFLQYEMKGCNET